MTPRNILLLGSAGVIAYDAIASVASIALRFPYAAASIGSIALYVAIGAAAARTKSRSFAFTAGTVAGLTDATVGWAVSWLVGPGRPASGEINLSQWVLTAVAVVVMASIVAGVGGFIATFRRPSVRT